VLPALVATACGRPGGIAGCESQRLYKPARILLPERHSLCKRPPNYQNGGWRNSSGSSAKFAAMRWASALVSRLVAERRLVVEMEHRVARAPANRAILTAPGMGLPSWNKN
jgi:hypothetical protein